MRKSQQLNLTELTGFKSVPISGAFGQFSEPIMKDKLDDTLWRQVSNAYLSANESVMRLSQLDPQLSSYSPLLQKKLKQLDALMRGKYTPLLRFHSNSVTEVTVEDKALLLQFSNNIVASGFTTSMMSSWGDLERCLDKFIATQ